MCMGATCGTCSKKTWRGCGRHVASAMVGVPESEWCICEPKVEFEGTKYPPAAKMSIPGASWLGSVLGVGGAKKDEGKKDEL